MSSRVQKGNAVFRPVGKARPRATPASASRQTSIAPNPSQDAVPSGPSKDMPPPPVPSSKSISDAAPSTSIPVLSPTPQTSPPTLARSTPVPVPNTASPSIPQNASPVLLQLPNQNTPRANVIPIPVAAPSRPPTIIGAPTIAANTAQIQSPEPPHPTGTALSVPTNGSQGIALSIPTNTAQRNPPMIPHAGTTLNVPSNNGPQGNILSVPSNAPASSQPDVNAVAGPSKEKVAETNGSQAKGKRKRKGSPTDVPEGEQADGPESASKKGRGGRRSRAPSLPPYDPSADPGEEIDPTAVTMAELCEDSGHGRVSSKAVEILSSHAAWKQNNREKRKRMRAIMEAKKYGRTDEEAELIADGEEPVPTLPTPVKSASSDSPADADNPDFDYSENLERSRFTVQVKIGPNGETIIDDTSLVVEREETDETANYTHVTESDHTKFVNSGTYGKRFRGSRWSAEETELFYEALQQFGENYELIAFVLPGRDRKSCKNKFKIEDKKNTARINWTLNNKIDVDMETLSRMTGKDFSGPCPEIRAPTPRPQAIPPPSGESTAPASDLPAPKAKRRRTKSSGGDDGVVIVGDIGSMPIETEDS